MQSPIVPIGQASALRQKRAMASSEAAHAATTAANLVVVDIGGTSVKVLVKVGEELRLLRAKWNGEDRTPSNMARKVREKLTEQGLDSSVQAMVVGCSGAIENDTVATPPPNLDGDWVGFDFGRALGDGKIPVLVTNDGALQAWGSYGLKPNLGQTGTSLFIGVGTGVGHAEILVSNRDGRVTAQVLGSEQGHMLMSPKRIKAQLEAAKAKQPFDIRKKFKSGEVETYLGGAALAADSERWQKNLLYALLSYAQLNPNLKEIVVGGGSIQAIKSFEALKESFDESCALLGLPKMELKLGGNDRAYEGGVRYFKTRMAQLSE